MILAGDIGGTHARLAFFEFTDGHFRLGPASVFPSRDYSGLDEIAAKFVRSTGIHPEAACFGIAGPVHNGTVSTSNLPWVIESQVLAKELQVPKAILINDLEASAWGIASLNPGDAFPLNQEPGDTFGNQAVIAAGTGLGEAGIWSDGVQQRIIASEGGHADFAPRNELEVELFTYLSAQFGHVSYERVLSGPGLVNVFHFLRDTGRGSEPEWLTEEMAQSDPAAAIARAADDAKCELSAKAMEVFIAVYGAEAGNLALRMMATGGVFLAGGIAPKILPHLSEAAFMKAFQDKGRMKPVLEKIPVKVITNDRVALLGAARCAVVRSRG
jgi:glucokinase